VARPAGLKRPPFLGPDGALTAALSLLVMVGSLGVTLLLVSAQVRRVARTAPNTEGAARAIVLGHRLEDGRPCATYAARLQRAAALAAADPNLTLVLLGGVTETDGLSEASAGRAHLLALGVAAERVAVEEVSRHTLENLRAFRDGFPASPMPDLLVTSRAHLARSLAIAGGLGLRLLPCAAEGPGPVPPKVLLREALLLHWYYVGVFFARATRNRPMLARVT